jgi:hypothetical protein
MPHRRQAFRRRSLNSLVGLASLLIPVAVHGQDIGPVSFRDSLVMRRVALLAPCPTQVPPGWTLVDRTLGSGMRCSLVEAAARALEQQLEQRPALRSRADPRNPLCVRVVVATDTGSTGLPGDWLVLFDLAPELSARVMIDRQTGGIVTGIVGRPDTTGNTPPCIAKERNWGQSRISRQRRKLGSESNFTPTS